MIPTGFDDNIIYQIGRITRFFGNGLNQTFRNAGYDITGEQFSILAMLFYQDGVSQQEISLQIERDKTTVSRVVSGMIQKDLIVRSESEKDKREKIITLTETGKKIQKELVMLGGQMYMSALNDIDEFELKTTIKVLQKIVKNIKDRS